MTINFDDNQKISLGIELEYWNDWEIKVPVYMDMSEKKNKHLLLTGFSGSGKSTAELRILAYVFDMFPDCECYFADFKAEDEFEFLRNCKNYFPYDRTLEALQIVYEKMHARQEKTDLSRNLVILCFDELFANILSIQNRDKRLASKMIDYVGEILMLGRSFNIQLICCVQRPDAELFKHGARTNFGIIMVLGASDQSVYEMVFSKKYIAKIENVDFGIGEGAVLLNGNEFHLIKIPMIRDRGKIEAICIKALS